MSEDFAWAVKTGDLDRVKEFVEKEKLSVKTTDGNQRTPLHWAADFNQVSVMEYLLSKGADVNAKDKYGITPLLAAVYEDKANAVKFLLANKADPSVKGPDGQTAKERADTAEIKKLLQ